MTLKTLWTLICFNKERRLQLQSPFFIILCVPLSADVLLAD